MVFNYPWFDTSVGGLHWYNSKYFTRYSDFTFVGDLTLVELKAFHPGILHVRVVLPLWEI